MSRTKGSFSLAGAIEPLISAPLDARTKVATKAELTVSGNFPYPYIGMETYVESEDKKYRLIGNDPTDISNWKEVGTGGGGSSALADLTDVNLTSPTDGQILKYDATSGKWINGSGGSVTVASLGDIEDVNLSNIADGQIIKWDATASKWVNANAPKERELTQAEYNALSQQEKMNGTTYFITDGEGGGAYSVQSATLSAGETTVTFTVPTTGNYLLNVYTSDGRDYTDVDTSVSGSVTLTFNSPSSDVTVYLEAKGV